MLNNIKKYSEYCFFIVINIFLWIPIYIKFLLNSNNIAEYIAVNIYKSDITEIRELNNPIGVILLISIFFTFIIIKPFLFHFLDIMPNVFPNIHNFLDKIRINKIFRFKFLLSIFLMDIIGIVWFKIGYWGLLGLLFNYCLFLLFFIPVNKYNIDESGKIIQSQGIIAKWATIIILTFI